MAIDFKKFDEFLKVAKSEKFDGIMCSWWHTKTDVMLPGKSGLEKHGAAYCLGPSYHPLKEIENLSDVVAGANVKADWSFFILWASHGHPASLEELEQAVNDRLLTIAKSPPPKGNEGWSYFADGLAFGKNGERVHEIDFPVGPTN